MLCCGFVGRGVKYVVLPLVFSYFLLAISRDPRDREPSQWGTLKYKKLR